MEALLLAATELVALLSPSRIGALADRIRGPVPKNDGNLLQLVTTPAARGALDRLLRAWEKTPVSGDTLAGVLVGAAYARRQAQLQTSIELVWTGPTTPYVPTRRTEQVLLDLIDRAQLDLFLVSFVTYDASSVVGALNAAVDRGVEVRILLEASLSHGGSLAVDPIATMRTLVSEAELFIWAGRSPPFIGGRVHAKVAVADGNRAFITSANLTGHALEKNMEAGVLIDGGEIPSGLRSHLQALIETGIIRLV